MRQFELKKFVGDAIITRYISGPADHEEWLASWRVYRTALIALGAASAGALELYAEGIRMLNLLYPRSWGDILLADEDMRYENWDRMLENLEEAVNPAQGFSKQRPWDHIIATSAFNLGNEGTEVGWWNLNLVAGLNSPQSTLAVTQALTGRPSSGQASSSRSSPLLALHDISQDHRAGTKKGGGKGDKGSKGEKGLMSQMELPSEMRPQPLSERLLA